MKIPSKSLTPQNSVPSGDPGLPRLSSALSGGERLPGCRAPEYAAEMGAHYYAKDAKQAVDIAKEVLGN